MKKQRNCDNMPSTKNYRIKKNLKWGEYEGNIINKGSEIWENLRIKNNEYDVGIFRDN